MFIRAVLATAVVCFLAANHLSVDAKCHRHAHRPPSCRRSGRDVSVKSADDYAFLRSLRQVIPYEVDHQRALSIQDHLGYLELGNVVTPAQLSHHPGESQQRGQLLHCELDKLNFNCFQARQILDRIRADKDALISAVGAAPAEIAKAVKEIERLEETLDELLCQVHIGINAIKQL